MDIESRPKLNHKGIVCSNKNGTWSVQCIRRGDNKANTEMASIVCFSLGFSGYNFFNISRVDVNGEIQTRRPPVQARNDYYREFLPWKTRQTVNFGRGLFKRSIERVVNLPHEIVVSATSNQCNTLYLECVPHSNIPPEESGSTPTGQTTVNPEPLPTTLPSPPEDVNNNDHTTEPIQPPNMKTTNSPIEPDLSHHDRPAGNETEPRIIENNFSAPWIASIYIDGDLACIGVLLDRQWVIVENSCVDSVE